MKPSTAVRRQRSLPRRLVTTAAGAVLIAAGLTNGGCVLLDAPRYGEITATPLFSTEERTTRILRNIDLELKMLNDDLDRALLLRPVSGLTVHNIP